jgi:hypothetical protein
MINSNLLISVDGVLLYPFANPAFCSVSAIALLGDNLDNTVADRARSGKRQAYLVSLIFNGRTAELIFPNSFEGPGR